MLPKPPQPEPPRIWTLDGLAPAFRRAVEAVLVDLSQERVFETLRTNERQAWLYGFGRTWDDGRGAVTKAPTADYGWHFYGLAVDIVQDDATPWVAPVSFWQALGLSAERHGCVWGGRWTTVDLPHIQWGKCRPSPTAQLRALYKSGGRAAVWSAVGAH